jgi:hypothetical protein
MTCLAVGGLVLALSSPAFSLHWVHSVEKLEWQEDWVIENQSLRLRTARVKGSGAGMEPAEGARLQGGWWVWHPEMVVPAITLAASGTTQGGWHLCSGPECREIGAKAAMPLVITPCLP